MNPEKKPKKSLSNIKEEKNTKKSTEVKSSGPITAFSKDLKTGTQAERKEAVSTKGAAKYIETIGRRKTSRARIRLWTKGDKVILVNEKSYKEYFPSFELQQIVTSPLALIKLMDKFRITVRVSGGGIHSQAEAVRHGIARALVRFNSDFRKKLRRAGFLTRDPRMRERKKFGLKRARRAPQWQKR